MRGLRLGLGLSRPGSNAFNPASLFSGAAGAWYDPSDLSTMFKDVAGTQPVTTDGDAVARINDKSGNGNHLTQSSAPNRPFYRTSGGVAWLEFTGATVAMALSGGDVLDLGTNGYFGAIAARLSSAATQGLFAKSLAGSSVGRYGLLKDTTLTSVYQNAVGDQNKTAAYSATTDAVLTAKLNRAGTNRLRVNGANQGSDAAFTAETADQNTANIFFLGAYNDATGTGALGGYFLNGRIYGLILKIAATPSDAEIAQAETWLGTKAGLVI